MATTLAPAKMPVQPAVKPPAPPQANLFATAAVIILAAIAAIVILKIPALSSPWSQRYDPTGHWWLSTILAALPIIVLLGSLALGHVKAHYAALAGLAAALLTAIFAFHMPARLAAATAVYGAGYGLFPIGWIVLNVIFMYQLTVESGQFNILQHSLTGITQDRRLQLLLIAFCFGAFLPVGGDASFQPDNPEKSRGKLVLFSGIPATGCGTRVDSEGWSGALWVFSPYACGVYGFGKSVVIVSDGSTDPVGSIVLASRKNVLVHAGSGFLLRAE